MYIRQQQPCSTVKTTICNRPYLGHVFHQSLSQQFFKLSVVWQCPIGMKLALLMLVWNWIFALDALLHDFKPKLFRCLLVVNLLLCNCASLQCVVCFCRLSMLVWIAVLFLMGLVRLLLWAFVFNVMMRYSNSKQKSIGELMSRYYHTHQMSYLCIYIPFVNTCVITIYFTMSVDETWWWYY